MPVEYRKFISREMLKSEPDTLFVFGDNMARKGFGGQAKEMRGEPNAVGIPTKKTPSDAPNAFFSDADFLDAKKMIDEGIERLISHLENSGNVVWPADGIGTGFAALPERAPAIWKYLEGCRTRLEEI